MSATSLDRRPIGRSRFDAFIIWGHGFARTDSILSEIRANSGFQILRIQHTALLGLRSFVYELYRHDPVPSRHLYAKLRGLLTGPSEAVFVIVKNLNVDERVVGAPPFRQVQCRNLVALKWAIRERFNPRAADGSLTHHHVIHGTDNEAQADRIARMLGLEHGVATFADGTSGDALPYHLASRFRVVAVRNVPLADLRARILIPGRKGVPMTTLVGIEDTPHFQGLTSDMRIYCDYLERYRFRQLLDDHHPSNLLKISEMVSKGAPFAPITVIEDNSQLIIVDGIHRASSQLAAGHSVTTCQVAARR